VHPRLRRLIAGAGAACLTASAVCFASEGALRAAPLLGIRLRLPFMAPQTALDVPAPTPVPLPSDKPSALPARRSMLGQGPIVLTGTGTYQLGINRSSRNGLATGYDNYSSALSVGIERRTEQSAINVTSGFGYGGNGLAVGTMIVGYRTPRYSLSYGQVTGPSDSQLQIGGFARGMSLSVPLRNGDVSYLVSTANQQLDNGITYRVYGIRRNLSALGGYLSMGGYYGAAEQGRGRETIADLGFRHYGAKLSTDTELALSNTGGVAGVATGTRLAGAFQADLQGKSVFTTANVRFDPAGFQTLTGTLDGGLSASLAVRKQSPWFGDIAMSLSHLDDRTDASVSHDDRITITGGRSWGKIGLQYVTGLDASRTDAGSTLQHTSAVTLSESFKDLALFETVQAASTSGATGAAGQRQVSLGLTRPMFGGTFAYQVARSTTTGGESLGSDTAHSFSYHRPVGRKLDLQFTQTFEHTDNNGALTGLRETGVSLVRRLSPVVAIQVSASYFQQTGLGGGRGTIFAASLVGPFGFGQSQTVGRANPNLPAVIRGLVTFSTSANPFAYNQSPQRGYNNALIILDGKVTQRTDAGGEFEFRFVPQGTHTLRIDPATISPGLIADREYATITVQGGQTTTIQFNVGNFAGVAGTVLAQEKDGQKHPLGGVGIAVDGIQAGFTTADGHYQVGRLSPGAHTVTLVDATVPSTVAFLDDKKRTVTVTPGTLTAVNFVATQLGSISGTVLAPSDGGFGQLVGLHNVYVVADPGDHAAITDDDGTFILDNMAPGSYTLTVDKDTIPDGLSVLTGPDGPLAISGGASLSGVIFKLGAAAKDVVYTFNDGKRQAIQVLVDPVSAPPGASLRIRATSNAKDLKGLFVESDVFGTFPLRLDPRQGAWLGTVIVPPLAKGDYAMTVTAKRKDVNDGSALVPIDPAIPLFAVRINPRTPQAGQTVKVTLKTLGAVEQGDTVLFEDGYKLVLPRSAGRVFTFDMRVWRKGLPYVATIVTKRGQNYPLTLH
jgi:hypothetical protein